MGEKAKVFKKLGKKKDNGPRLGSSDRLPRESQAGSEGEMDV